MAEDGEHGKSAECPNGEHTSGGCLFQTYCCGSNWTDRTSKRNRLTIHFDAVDYATRYAEAVPLKRINTETIAEALVDIYSRLGVPEEILSYQET